MPLKISCNRSTHLHIKCKNRNFLLFLPPFFSFYMHLFDNHNHSQFSFDGGRTSVAASARAAIAAGLDGICFSDHCDHYVPAMKASFEDLKPEYFDVPQQQAEITRVQGLLGDNIKILKGIEIGMYEECHEPIRRTLEENSFDRSSHLSTT